MPSPGRVARAAIHQRLATEVRELREKLSGLPRPADAEAIWRDIWIHEAHNSTAIEGNTLVLREVEKLLTENRAVGNKELKEYLEVKGYADAAQWVYRQGVGAEELGGEALLTVTEIRRVHALAMTPVWDVAPHGLARDDESPGNWRRHDIRAFGSGMHPPPFTEVPGLVHDWVEGVNRLADDGAPIAEAVAKRHAAFERIHPFLDGNGRTGRLLANLVLVRLGYPPAIIQKRERRVYLRGLQQADGGNDGLLGELFARAILDNLMRFVIPAVAGPARLVPLEALATADLGVRALRAAAERGRLRAQRGPDRVWRSTRRWVEDYADHRYGRLTPRIPTNVVSLSENKSHNTTGTPAPPSEEKRP